MIKEIQSLIQQAVGEDKAINIEIPENPAHGHYATSVALRLARREKKPPLEIAKELALKIKEGDQKGFFEKVEAAPPGFINFWLSKKALAGEFLKVVKIRAPYGKSTKGRGRKVIFEYSDPNIAKRMHVGHMRATIIGDALANIFEFLGYKAVRWNYLGDWGTQFGKIITAYKLWGRREEVRKIPIESLQKLYVLFHEKTKSDPALEDRAREEFKKLEEGNAENRKLWQWFKTESLKEFNRIYRAFGVSFDTYIGESFYEAKMKPLVERLLRSGIAKRSEGSVIIPLDEFNLPPALIQKSDGASLYLTRDIANLEYRISKYKAERIVYVVGNEQTLHFSQLFSIAQLLGIQGSGFIHVKYGLVLGSDSKKLATREGRTILLEKVISKAIDLTRRIVEKKNRGFSAGQREAIARAVGIAALKYNDLSQNRLSDITFDWDKMLNLEGNSAPYLMYTYARLRSILRKAKKPRRFDADTLESRSDTDLILTLLRFPDALEKITQDYFPHHLTDYLYKLAKQANAFYQIEPVLKAEPKLRDARLALVGAIADTLKTGLDLLGIRSLERM